MGILTRRWTHTSLRLSRTELVEGSMLDVHALVCSPHTLSFSCSCLRRHLTSSKKAYLKLRFLVDAGCTFVGHGLIKDFHMINITVPPEQVRWQMRCACRIVLQ